VIHQIYKSIINRHDKLHKLYYLYIQIALLFEEIRELIIELR